MSCLTEATIAIAETLISLRVIGLAVTAYVASTWARGLTLKAAPPAGGHHPHPLLSHHRRNKTDSDRPLRLQWCIRVLWGCRSRPEAPPAPETHRAWGANHRRHPWSGWPPAKRARAAELNGVLESDPLRFAASSTSRSRISKSAAVGPPDCTWHPSRRRHLPKPLCSRTS